MTGKTGQPDRAKRLGALRYKYSFRGRLERFCEGRVRILPIRLAYQAAGSTLAAFFGDWRMGLLAFVCCISGELIEGLTVSWARRGDRIRRQPRKSGRWVSFGSIAWATGMAGGVTALWSIGGVAYWFLSFVFLFSALVNAQLVGGLHTPSLRVKQFILAGVGLSLVGDAYVAGNAVENVEVFAISALIMALTLLGLFARLNLQNQRRHEAEHDLIEAQLDIEQKNEALQASKERLREHVQKAESLAFDSQAANRAKSQFLATMSREVRAPMNRILETAGDMKFKRLAPGQEDALNTIVGEGTALLGIVEDILDLSKAEAGKLQIEREEFSLKALWDDILEVAKPIAADKGIGLNSDAKIVEGVALMGDEARIRQVLLNLLKHAIRTTPTGDVSISLATKRVSNELSLCFSVTDSGPGITRSNLSRLFGGLDDRGPDSSARAGGNGLGLAVSRRLARLMGGDLHAQSEIGNGSTFTLILPMQLSEMQDDNPENTSRKAHIDLTGGHVMIVNDSADNTRILERLLGATGAELSLNQTSDPLLERVYDLAPDIIIMDISPPLEAGLKATKMIREAEAAAGSGRCMIIATTSTALAEDRRRCLAAGVDTVVPKPITRGRLFAALDTVSAGAAARKSA